MFYRLGTLPAAKLVGSIPNSLCLLVNEILFNCVGKEKHPDSSLLLAQLRFQNTESCCLDSQFTHLPTKDTSGD